jgi:hypothetical protein
MKIRNKSRHGESERKYTQKRQAIFICDQGLGFKALLVNVCNHGKPCNFTIIKALIGNTSRF